MACCGLEVIECCVLLDKALCLTFFCCLFVALVLGFDWGKYLQEHGFKAAPVSCFKHVSSLLCLTVCVVHVACTGLCGGEWREAWGEACLSTVCEEGSWGFSQPRVGGSPMGGTFNFKGGSRGVLPVVMCLYWGGFDWVGWQTVPSCLCDFCG